MKKPLLLLGTTLALCTSAFNPTFAQTTEEISKSNCKKTSDVCQKTLDYCTTKKGKYATDTVTGALKDCIISCNATEKFINRGSGLKKKAAALTIDACNAVAKSCDQFAEDDRMQACANEARKCVGNLQKVM